MQDQFTQRASRNNCGFRADPGSLSGQGDTSAGQVARSDMARVCLAALTNTHAKNVTLKLSSKKGSVAPAVELRSMFKGLQPDGNK